MALYHPNFEWWGGEEHATQYSDILQNVKILAE